MCTAISVTYHNHYFGRNLDYEHSFGEKIVITPRNYPFEFANGINLNNHFALIGMALPYKNYPLYFDATNEKGLSMAGLNFPDNAHYNKKILGKSNIASYEFIPWVLSQCESVNDAKDLLKNANITDDAFDKHLTPSPLHWLIADKYASITIEQTLSGLRLFENPVGVLTNNPAFDMQLFNLRNYLSVSANDPENKFSEKINLKPYSRGMGALGIPGDLSSMSRFIRACFTKLNSVFGNSETETVNQFFHILYSVYQQKGCVKVGNEYEITQYTSCCNTDKGIYYYTTYYNSCITAVDMNKAELDSDALVVCELVSGKGF